MDHFKKELNFLGSELLNEIFEYGIYKEIAINTEILKENQFVSYLPIVLSGIVKVFSRYDDRELLLYYIQPKQSCVMSFSAIIKHLPSKIYAVAETDVEVLLLPVEKINYWIKKYPSFNDLMFNQYDLRYNELLENMEHLLFDKIDKRLYDYLVEKIKITSQQSIKLSHSKIANEIGTVREVVTRTLKKLESEEKISQENSEIKIL